MPCAAALPPTYGTYFFFTLKKEVSKKKRVFAVFLSRGKNYSKKKRVFAVFLSRGKKQNREGGTMPCAAAIPIFDLTAPAVSLLSDRWWSGGS